MANFRTLLVCENLEYSAASCIVSKEGLPVWPISDEQARIAIERIAQLFASSLKLVDAKPIERESIFANENNGNSEEIVVALGEGCHTYARLYAHLTQRKLQIVPHAKVLRSEVNPSVVVTSPEYLSVELLEQLYSHSDESAVGIICSEPGPKLLRQVLVRSAAAKLSGPLKMIRKDLYPTLPLGAIKRAGFQILGSHTSVTDRRQAITEGVGVLTIMTHSDGVDAFMGPKLTVCVMNQELSNSHTHTAPQCRLSGICHRHSMSVEQVLESNLTLKPESITARVLIWDVCFGIMLKESFVDPSYGIGQRLLDSANLGAIISSWGIIISSPDQHRDISRWIASGVPAGVAVARFNRSRASRLKRHRMCLLGDPKVRLPITVSQQQIQPSLVSRKKRQCVSDRVQIQQLALLRLCMADAKRRNPKGSLGEAATLALESIGEFELEAVRTSPMEALNSPFGKSMHEAVICYVQTRGKLVESWMPFTQKLQAAKALYCPVCCRQASFLKATMKLTGVLARQIVICPVCGVVEDAPIDWKVSISLLGRRIYLDGDVLGPAVTAGIVISPSNHAESIKILWPIDDQGGLKSYAELPGRWPLGPLRISVIIMRNTNLAVVSRMAREPSRR